MILEIQKIAERLSLIGKYSHIIENLGQSPSLNWSCVFEMFFANEFVINGQYLEYEVNVNPKNNKTIDFIYQTEGNTSFLFELVRPEMSDILGHEYNQKMYGDGIIISSDHENEKLRPEAQTIRLQEKILEKVDKFPEADEKYFSVIVVDCSNFHFGHFDDEDARIIMYGRSKNSILQEHWNGKRTLGMLEKEHHGRYIKDFQRRVTAVVFIPVIRENKLLSEVKIICNTYRSEQHRVLFHSMLNDLRPFIDIKWL